MSEIYGDKDFELEEIHNKNLSIWIHKIKIVNIEIVHLPPFNKFIGGCEYNIAKERFDKLSKY